MSFELRFTTEAEETFDLLISQLRERWGDRFVVKLENKIAKACIQFPKLSIYTQLRKKIQQQENVYFIKIAQCFTKFTTM